MARGSSNQQYIYYNSPYIIKNIISSYYGFKQKIKRHGNFFNEYYKSLNESQWFDNNRLIKLQKQKLIEFLKYAFTNSKYYSTLLKNIKMNISDINNSDFLNSIPILNKQTIRKEFNSIYINNNSINNLAWSESSGTTGKSLKIPITSECFQREHAFRELHYTWGGINHNDRIAVCAGHPVAYINREKPPFWTYDYANNWLLLSSYHLTEQNIPYYLKEIERFNPQLLKGYPSSLYILAIANKKFGFNIKPKAIYTASETLLDFQRKMIEESFEVKVYSWYGTAEMSGNIVECEQGNNHLKLEHSYVEILDNKNEQAKTGEEGRLVCTAFGNYAIPLIRYDIGDIAIRSKKNNCECGRGGPLIEKLIGRVEDYIITPDGRFIGRLDHILKDIRNVKNAQIVQHKIDNIVIRIVKENNFSNNDEQKILINARQRLGSELEIKIEYVSEILKEKGSKYKFIVSKINKKKLYNTFLN